jgi:hypothetical protein
MGFMGSRESRSRGGEQADEAGKERQGILITRIVVIIHACVHSRKNAPKPALSAFFLFSHAVRDQVKAENPNASFGELGRIIGKLWKDLPEADKKAFLIPFQFDNEMRYFILIGKRKNSIARQNLCSKLILSYQ